MPRLITIADSGIKPKSLMTSLRTHLRGWCTRPASLNSYLIRLIIAGLGPILLFSVFMMVLFARQEQANRRRGQCFPRYCSAHPEHPKELAEHHAVRSQGAAARQHCQSLGGKLERHQSRKPEFGIAHAPPRDQRFPGDGFA